MKDLSAVADERRRTDKLDGVIKHRSSRETTMVGRGASLDGRLFLSGTDGSNPVPSAGLLFPAVRVSRAAASSYCRTSALRLSAPAGLFIERLISNATGVPARAMPAAQSPHRFKKRRDEWETISEWRRRTASLPLLPVDD